MADSEYRPTLDRLFRRRRFGMRPGLDAIQALLKGLGDPQTTFRAIHIAGSKGKGSVAAMATRVLQETGIRTGRFTSPHLVSYRERIQVDGRPIPRSAVVAGLARIEEVADRLLGAGRLERPPTFFEVTTALAFEFFREKGVQQAVVEVGIGGRLDSTNVVRADVGVVTTIEYEHTDILGPTLAQIAGEKAGILHAGMRGVIGALPSEAIREVRNRATAVGVPLWELGREMGFSGRELSGHGQRFTVTTPRGSIPVELALMGTFQPSNAVLAVAATQNYAEATGRPISADDIRRGLERTRWRGRVERVARRPDFYLDVAHTVESARAVAESLGEIVPFSDPADNAILFSCLRDKPVELILERLVPLAQTIVFVPLRSDRGLDVAAMTRAAVGQFPKRVQAPSVADGLRLARAATSSDGFTLAVGSDYLVGEALCAIEGIDPEEPDLGDPLSANQLAEAAAEARR